MEFQSPVGRLVQGDVLKPQTTGKDGKPLLVKTGPNAGQPRTSFFIAVAIPKTPGAQAWYQEQHPMFQAIYQTGRAGFPQGFNPSTGLPNHPRFAWKITDGDGNDEEGKPNNTKPGFAGHWVVKFSNGFAPKLIQNGAYINDPEFCKRGYYVRVLGDIAPNTGAEVPGVYLNFYGVELVAYGEVIAGGPDVLAGFAKAGAAALPPGASLTPLANGPIGIAPPAAPGMPGMQPPGPAQTFQPPAALQAIANPVPNMGLVAPAMPGIPAGPQLGAPPNPGFVAGAIGTPPALPVLTPPQIQMPPAQPVYGPGPNAQGFQPAQWLAQGHPADQLIAAGCIVRTA